MRFSEHIGELRKRLKKVFEVFLVALIIVVFMPSNPLNQLQHLGDYLSLQFLNNTIVSYVLHQVVAYVLPQSWTLIAANGIGEGMEVYFIAALLMATLISMPVMAYETYKFIDPALKAEERKLLYPFVIATSSLFTVGCLFGYLIMAKFLIISLAPFFTASVVSPFIDAAAFYNVVFLVVGASGAAFTAPVFVYALIRLRVIESEFFSRNRVVIWFVIWVITGLFLTPDGGPLLDLVIFLPIMVLVEGAVFLAGRAVRRDPNYRPRNAAPPKCQFCGTKLNPRSIFCPSCGKAN